MANTETSAGGGAVSDSLRKPARRPPALASIEGGNSRVRTEAAMTSGWPFKSIDSSKVAKLDPKVLKKLEDALLFASSVILEVDIRISTGPEASSRCPGHLRLAWSAPEGARHG